MSDEELLKTACENAGSFPANSIRSITSEQHLEGYRKRLHDHAGRLFWEDGKASLDIWEYNDTFAEFQNTNVTSTAELKGRLVGAQLFIHDDPRCRFLFIHARNSREKLKISREMFTFALTYYQVMPSFLDFVFPFGHQHFAEDFHFSGFREDTRLLPSDEALKILDLGRSGREVRLCYSLKSVEPNDFKTEWPWAVRQVAVYHSFDLETGKAFWIVIKGGHLIRDRVKSATDPASTGAPDLKSSLSTSSLFAATLGTHLILCDWCDEEWRWYLNYVENRLQDATRRALAITIDHEPSLFEEPIHPEVKSPSSPSIFRSLTEKTKRTFSTMSRQTKSSTGLEKQKVQAPFAYPPPQFPSLPPSGPPPAPTIPPGMPGAMPNDKKMADDEAFTFKNLQLVQYFEEKANEVAPVLEANIDILTELKEHYQSILKSDDFPDEFKLSCKLAVAQFEKRVNWIITDLQRQRSRTMILKTLLSDRKGLLYGILNKQAIETSKILTKKAQISAEKMQVVTDSMHDIAKKTKQETVSMKIITLVTLFFLPGTFISTIMSTDILQFTNNREDFSPRALQIYLGVTIPFMVLTFAAWRILYLWTKKRELAKGNEKGNRTASGDSLV